MTDKKSPTLADPLDPEQVADYLRHHPEFFVDHQELLGDLFLPHESGPAVSLVERQVSILRERNIDMRNRLSKLLDNARENDKLFDKTKRLVLSLLEGQDLGDIVDALHYSFDKDLIFISPVCSCTAISTNFPAARHRWFPSPRPVNILRLC